MLTAQVQFQHEYDKERFSGKYYDFLSFMTDLKAGDLVVVETQYGYSIAKFVGYTAAPKVNPSKYIITSVDLTKFKEQKKQAEKVKELESKIESRMKLVNRRKVYEQLAEHDETMKALLAELDEASKEVL